MNKIIRYNGRTFIVHYTDINNISEIIEIGDINCDNTKITTIDNCYNTLVAIFKKSL
jgi:hypothetical protein